MRSMCVCITKHIAKYFTYILRFILFCLFYDPICKNRISVRTNHAASPSLSKWPFWHITTVSIYQNKTFSDIFESFWILKKQPWHLSSMNIPKRHICVNILHINRYNTNRSIIFERRIFAIDIIEKSWGQHGSINSCIYFSLIILCYG